MGRRMSPKVATDYSPRHSRGFGSSVYHPGMGLPEQLCHLWYLSYDYDVVSTT